MEGGGGGDIPFLDSYSQEYSSSTSMTDCTVSIVSTLLHDHKRMNAFKWRIQHHVNHQRSSPCVITSPKYVMTHVISEAT